jgi:hypothetical protein
MRLKDDDAIDTEEDVCQAGGGLSDRQSAFSTDPPTSSIQQASASYGPSETPDSALANALWRDTGSDAELAIANMADSTAPGEGSLTIGIGGSSIMDGITLDESRKMAALAEEIAIDGTAPTESGEPWQIRDRAVPNDDAKALSAKPETLPFDGNVHPFATNAWAQKDRSTPQMAALPTDVREAALTPAARPLPTSVSRPQARPLPQAWAERAGGDDRWKKYADRQTSATTQP